MTPYCRATTAPPPPPRLGLPTLAEVIGVAAQVFGVSSAELRGPSQRRPLVRYRHATMAACRLLTGESYPTIAEAFNGRDHTTVMHGCKRAQGTPLLDDLLAVFGSQWQGVAELLARPS